MSAADASPAFREVEIDGAALARNIARALATLPDDAPRVIDLGANAFGCDATLVAPVAAAAGCTHALVGRVAEALALAAEPAVAGLTLLCSDPLAAEARAELDAAAVLIVERSADAVRAAFAGGAPSVVLILDSGRGIPGVARDELPALRAAAGRAQVLVVDPAQVLGAAVFGLDAGDEVSLPLPDPEAVMTLWAPVVGLKTVGADEGVSYGYRYRTADRTTLALVSLGYADGLDRAAGNALDARVGDATHTIAGRVAMDAFVIDVGHDASVAVGDRVTVWGGARTGVPTIADAAARLGTHSAELATRLTARPRRRIRPSGDDA